MDYAAGPFRHPVCCGGMEPNGSDLVSVGMAIESCHALVLNADFRPLSYFPLSLWPWQDSIKAVFLDRVNVLAEYDEVVRSPTVEMRVPSVISLKEYVAPARRPAFTRFNVFLRDRFDCQYCGHRFAPERPPPAGERSRLPAQLSAPELGRLSLLG